MSIALSGVVSALSGTRNDHNINKAKRIQNGLKKEQDNKKLWQACVDFEAIFINQMLTQMRKTVPKSDFLGNTSEEKIFRGMLDEKLSEESAKGGRLGIAKMMYNELRIKK